MKKVFSTQLVVDYSLALEQAVNTLNYVNPNLTSANFPHIHRGRLTMVFNLWDFGRSWETQEAVDFLAEQKCEKPSADNLAALGKHMDSRFDSLLQNKAGIVVPQAWHDPDGDSLVPFLWGNGNERWLSLGHFGGSWDRLCLLLGVRKIS